MIMRTPGKGGLTFGSNKAENEKKLRELILYVVEKCCDDSRFGATKLNKILFWSDFFAYANTGEPITGVEYMRLPNGPVPKRLVPVRNKMIEAGELDVAQRSLFNGRRQTKFLARRKADVSLFTPEQIDLVNEVIDYLRDQTASEVSDGSHTRAWHMASDGELIPYQSVFISDRGLIRSDIESAKKLAARFGWAERFAPHAEAALA